MSSMSTVWLSIPAAACHASVCENTIKSWMRSGLKHSRLGRNIVRIKVEHLDAYLEGFAVQSSADLLEQEIETIRPRVRKLARELARGLR